MRSRSRHLLAIAVLASVLAAACSSGGDDDETAPTTAAPTTAAPTTEAPTTTTAEATTTTVAGRWSAELARTSDGVTHVTAEDLPGAFFGQGWASARDHACTAADEIRKVRGTRAEVLGAGEDDRWLNSDFAWRHIGVAALADSQYGDLAPELQEMFEAFAAGWSRYVTEEGVGDAWCAEWIEPITAQDVYATSRAISLNASGSRLTGFLGSAEPPAPAGGEATTTTQALGALPRVDLGSNGWAIGSERSEGGPVLLGNPHFPWEGGLRFWESHLRVPGEVDIYGVQLVGLPGIGIGFNDAVAWTHTVSAGNRFTAYLLDVDPADPTRYLKDGQPVPMRSDEVTVEVADGEAVTRTLWWSEHGPMLNFPGIAWDTSRALTYRDANLDNDEFAQQYYDMATATSLEEFQAAHERNQGVPLFNTIAVGADGTAWYADTSATPNLSPEAIAAWEAAVASDPLVGAARGQGLVLLDGSTAANDWVEEDGARDPGLVPYARMPQRSEQTYAFNANDSFWMTNVEAPLAGPYSPLHGRQEVAQLPRTRMNAQVLREGSTLDLDGPDDRWTLDEVTAAALDDTGYLAFALRESVAQRCAGAAPVEVPALTDADGTVVLPAEAVDVTAVCVAITGWSGRYDLDARGAAAWREFVFQLPGAALREAGTLWAAPFDASRPVDTPAGLAEPVPGQPDQILQYLARAAQILAKEGVAADAPLGELQQADRGGVFVPIHGGTEREGVTNKVDTSGGFDTAEPLPELPPAAAPGSTMRGGTYPINNGTSWLMAVQFTPDGPDARVLLNYGPTGDRSSPLFSADTKRFSDKTWRTPLRLPEAVEADDPEVTTISGG